MVALLKTRVSTEAWSAPSSTLERVPTLPGETVWVLDDAGVILSVDGGVHDLLGYWPEDIVESALWWKRIHEEDRVRVQSALEALFLARASFDTEFRLQRRDGVWTWVHARAVAVATREDAPCAHVLVTDVTERRQLERKQFQRQRRTRAILSSAPFVTCWRRASGDFGPVFVSENITALYGYVPVELVRSSTFHGKIVHPADRAKVQAAMHRTVQEGRAECEYRLYDKRGDIRIVRDEMVAMFSREGEALEICSFWVDVTAAQKTESEARALEMSLAALIAHSPFPVAVIRDGRVLEANRAFAALQGLDALESAHGAEYRERPGSRLPTATLDTIHLGEPATLLLFSFT